MRIYIILLFVLIIIFLPFCKKDKPNSVPPKKQYAVFSDLVNGKKFQGLPITLLTYRTSGGILMDVPIAGTWITNSAGSIEYDDIGITGFECAVPGFFFFSHYGVGLIDYDGLTYNVKLLPKAFLNIHLAPSSIYPANYTFYMSWSCRDSLRPVNTYPNWPVDFQGFVKPVDSSFGLTIGGDIYNDVSWKLEDSNFNIIARDTIRNIVVPRFDTTNIEIAF